MAFNQKSIGVFKPKSLTQIYGRESFDRFGDDLAEKILEFIDFDDKFYLRCVSKQFQYCSENNLRKVSRVSFRGRSYTDAYVRKNYRNLEITFKYCPFVTWLELWIKTPVRVFNRVFTEWPKITEVVIYEFSYIHSKVFNKFCRTYGPTLKKIHYRGQLIDGPTMDAFVKIVKASPNLQCVTDVRFWNDRFWYLLYCNLTPAKLFHKEHLLVNKLTRLYFEYTPADYKYLPLLFEANKKTLKMVKVLFEGDKKEALARVFQQLARLTGLTSLYLKLKVDENTEPALIDGIQETSKSCRLIQKLTLSVAFLLPEPSASKIYDSFGLFPDLRRLVFYMSFPYPNAILPVTRPPKAPKSLINLDIKCYSSADLMILRNDFFSALIEQYPNLQTIQCLLVEEINEELLNILSRGRHLTMVEIDALRMNIDENKLKECIQRFPKLDSLGLRWTCGNCRYFYPKEFERTSQLGSALNQRISSITY